MKLNAEISGSTCAIDVRQEGTRVFAQIDDRSYEIEAQQTGPHSFLLTLDGRVFDCSVAGAVESGRQVSVNIGTRNYELALVDPRRLRGASVAGPQGDHAAHIVAPMPGKVVRVLVTAGAQIKAGEGVLVVEAMKMQNELKSPRDGVVSKIAVEAGVTVNAGDVLAIIEN